MGEREPYDLTRTAAETMYQLWELAYQQGERNPDQMMRRLKDLSAYSLNHNLGMGQREGVEMLALGMFFGLTSNPQIRSRNQDRLGLLSEDTLDYQGRADVVGEQVARRKKDVAHQNKEKDSNPLQPRLL